MLKILLLCVCCFHGIITASSTSSAHSVNSKLDIKKAHEDDKRKNETSDPHPEFTVHKNIMIYAYTETWGRIFIKETNHGFKGTIYNVSFIPKEKNQVSDTCYTEDDYWLKTFLGIKSMIRPLLKPSYDANLVPKWSETLRRFTIDSKEEAIEKNSEKPD